MRWLDTKPPPCRLQCPYCGITRPFPSAMSYEHEGDVFTLYACVKCGSLIYDLSNIDAPIVSTLEVMTPETERANRYTLETGFSSHYVALCGLAATPADIAGNGGNRVFVDVGAGIGMATYFAKYVLGMETLTVEPSFTGKLSSEIFGFTVHRAYFEDLPAEVLTALSGKACLLHLNSVVEHLVDPRQVLGKMISMVDVETIAMIVPDGAAVDPASPFASALPCLAPRDHRHLPTRAGMEFLLRSLGFQHYAVQTTHGLLIAVGSRNPVAVPAPRETKLAEVVFLQSLMRHPNPVVSAGAASRLLAHAFLGQDVNLTREIAGRLDIEAKCGSFLEQLRSGSLGDMPYHLGSTSYWLGYDAFQNGRPAAALGLLALTEAFADSIAKTNPDMAMTPLEFKWAAIALVAHIKTVQGDLTGARAAWEKTPYLRKRQAERRPADVYRPGPGAYRRPVDRRCRLTQPDCARIGAGTASAGEAARAITRLDTWLP